MWIPFDQPTSSSFDDLAGNHEIYNYGANYTVTNSAGAPNFVGHRLTHGWINRDANGVVVPNQAIALNERYQKHLIVRHASDIAANQKHTLEMYIQPMASGNWMGLASKATNSNNYSIMCAIDPDLYFGCYTRANGWILSNTPLRNNQWSHVAMTLDRPGAGYWRMKLYINGGLDTTRADITIGQPNG